jgi:hypothetical protein
VDFLPIIEQIHSCVEYDFIKNFFANALAFVLAAMLMVTLVMVVVFVSSIRSTRISDMIEASIAIGAFYKP